MVYERVIPRILAIPIPETPIKVVSAGIRDTFCIPSMFRLPVFPITDKTIGDMSRIPAKTAVIGNAGVENVR